MKCKRLILLPLVGMILTCLALSAYGTAASTRVLQELGVTPTATPETSIETPTLLQNVIYITAESVDYTCALTSIGSVKCWGLWNRYAQDIIGATSDIVAITGGGQHSCAITADGRAKCWGSNIHGELGDGTNDVSTITAIDVKGLPKGVTAIAGGYGFTCAVAHGEVYCWGENAYGQLGDGTTTNSTIPMRLQGISEEVIALTAGSHHACALTEEGGVYCWGRNQQYGALGDGARGARETPVQVSGLSSGVVAISAKNSHTCALTASGGVWCWGNNHTGQLGDGTTKVRRSPVQVSGLASGVSAISTGTLHSCALTENGNVKCWGDNRAGELGNETNIDNLTPVDVVGLTAPATAIAAGNEYTCAVVDGGVFCWGENQENQLGAEIDRSSQYPVDVVGLSGGMTSVAANGGTTCVVTSQGGVKCWGENNHSQLGDGTDVDRSTPVDVLGLSSGIAQVAIGNVHSCALTVGGEVRCWGADFSEQLGNPQIILSSPTPVDVVGLSTRVSIIAAGGNTTCALTEDSGVMCWGEGKTGKLGNGANEVSETPVDVIGLTSGVTFISVGYGHACAVIQDGRAFCWGDNSHGQLGDGTTDDSNLPVPVSGLTDAIAITASADHSCAITSAGGVKCWGDNFQGKLGDGTTTDSLMPVQVNGLPSGVVALTTGYDHTCALTSSGGALCWGSFSDIGNDHSGFRDNRTLVDVSSLTNGVIGIAAGRSHTCAITESGAKCWGNNWNGELGDGLGGDQNTPVPVILGAPRDIPLSEDGFRPAGPLVPVLTTYIPSPLDISLDLGVLGTNLFLAALMMLPFAVAAEFFTRTLSEHEEVLRRRNRPLAWISRLQDRLEAVAGTSLERRPGLQDAAKLLGVMFFYGLVFSLLDRTWNPFSLKGVILFLSMTIAYGVVGTIDDVLQWRAIRRWGLTAELRVRPTNVLLAVASTAITRILSLVPGLMFGTPEALHADEDALDEDKRKRLLKLRVITFTVIGMGVWLPTIATTLLQRLSLPEIPGNLLGGLEGFLLVIFAVAVENLFVQMLSFPGSLGRALKDRNRRLWLAALVGVAFLFYHTLLNPRGELAEALQEGNVLLFLGVATAFVAITLGMRLYFAWQQRRAAAPKKAQPVTDEVLGPIAALPAEQARQPISAKVDALILDLEHPDPTAQQTVVRDLIALGEPAVLPLIAFLQHPDQSARLMAASALGKLQDPRAVEPLRQILNDPDEDVCTMVQMALDELVKTVSPPTVKPEAQAAHVAAHPAVPSSEDVADTLPCPVCGEKIKLEARICRFCRASFEVTAKGYCLTCHDIVNVDGTKCARCGDEAEDVHFESRLLHAPSIPQTRAAPSPSHPRRRIVRLLIITGAVIITVNLGLIGIRLLSQGSGASWVSNLASKLAFKPASTLSSTSSTAAYVPSNLALASLLPASGEMPGEVQMVADAALSKDTLGVQFPPATATAIAANMEDQGWTLSHNRTYENKDGCSAEAGVLGIQFSMLVYETVEKASMAMQTYGSGEGSGEPFEHDPHIGEGAYLHWGQGTDSCSPPNDIRSIAIVFRRYNVSGRVIVASVTEAMSDDDLRALAVRLVQIIDDRILEVARER